MKPIVSVVIPTISSRKQLLERAIKTVKNQTYKKIELIIVDEGLPATVQRNIGIERAKGDYIALLDDDDEWYPTKIEKQVKFMESNLLCPLVICYSEDRRRTPYRISKPSNTITHKQLIKGFNLSSTSSYLLRKKDLKVLKVFDGYYFDESAPTGHEYDLALRISIFSDISCIPEVLMIQHKTPGQISENWGKKVKGQYYMMSKWGYKYGLVEYLKRIGLVGLFWMGYFIGDKVMIPINFMKKVHEKGRI